MYHFQNMKVSRKITLMVTFSLMVISIPFSAFGYSGYVGESISLPAPIVAGTIGGAAWTSSSNQVSVSGNAYGATARIFSYFTGTVTITCQYVYSYYSGGKTHYSSTQYARYEIQCMPSNLRLNKNKVTLKPGETVKLTYTNSSGYDAPGVAWTTSDKSIADFDIFYYGDALYDEKTVTIEALDVGTCTITCEGYTGGTAPTCEITVKANPPTGIAIKPESLNLLEGNQGTFSYEITPSDASKKLTWTSANENIAKVSGSGVVTAVSEGSTEIIVTTDNGLSAKGIVNVVPKPRTMTLPSTQKAIIGYSYQLKPILSPANAITTYTWETSDSKIASVDNDGNVKGKSAGTATITVKSDNGLTASCDVTVSAPADGLDYRNVGVRISTLKNLINKTLTHIK